MALTCLKGGTECGNNRVKNPIYAAPAVRGLTAMMLSQRRGQSVIQHYTAEV